MTISIKREPDGYAIHCSLSSDLAVLAERLQSGQKVCVYCRSFVSGLFRIPNRYKREATRYEFLDIEKCFACDDSIFAYACSYCISNFATRIRLRKGQFVTCEDCGNDFLQSSVERLSYWEYVALFGRAGWAEYGTLRAKNFGKLPRVLCARCRQKCKMRRKTYQKEITRVQGQNKRTQKRGLVSDLTIDQWLSVLDTFAWKCYYCLGEFSDMHHVIPVSAGGGTTVTNVVPVCERCNTHQWYRYKQQLLLR